MISLPVFLALVFAAAAFGAQFQPGGWYAGLIKPAWTPPSWLFPPIWTVLYIAIAIAGWLVWRTRPSYPALTYWAIALGLNSAWSWLFFGLHRPDLALVDILLLWAAIAAFMVSARYSNPLAAALFIPYLLWVTYAAVLNFAIWWLNSPR